MCFEMGMCPHFGLQAFMKAMDISWLVIIAAFFGFSSFSLDVYYIDSSPREPRFVLVRPRPGLGQASVSLGAPRMPTNLLHHGP